MQSPKLQPIHQIHCTIEHMDTLMALAPAFNLTGIDR
jgi:hypothetical protein